MQKNKSCIADVAGAGRPCAGVSAVNGIFLRKFAKVAPPVRAVPSKVGEPPPAATSHAPALKKIYPIPLSLHANFNNKISKAIDKIAKVCYT